MQYIIYSYIHNIYNIVVYNTYIVIHTHMHWGFTLTY